MKKVLLLLLCAGAMLCMQGCQKDMVAHSVKKLQKNKPEAFSEVTGKNSTLSLVTLCDDGFIGNLEQPHANMLVAEQADYFKKVCKAIAEVEEAVIRIVFRSKSNADEQVFEYSVDELNAITENPEKALQEAQEELSLIEEG